MYYGFKPDTLYLIHYSTLIHSNQLAVSSQECQL